MPEPLDRSNYEAAANGVQALVTANPETSFTLAHHDWPESALSKLPECVGVVTLD